MYAFACIGLPYGRNSRGGGLGGRSHLIGEGDLVSFIPPQCFLGKATKKEKKIPQLFQTPNITVCSDYTNTNEINIVADLFCLSGNFGSVREVSISKSCPGSRHNM